ncbi:MAG: DUF1653 domain-containing protein [Lachnospiraceae bacterium]|nr:DUF1653 domain-containing protein [Lachnospiraceae bacterium]MBQ8666490.1 DUF1653 domain-containing protein [Lachnospiraceae bacterium]
MRDLPKPGQVYRHFKGNIYRIITLATHSETGETLVIYKRDDAEKKSYARPLDMFLSEVDHKKYPDVRDKYRFTLCSEDVLSDLGIDDAEVADASGLDPLLEAFLDAGSITEKIDRLYDMRKSANDEMLKFVAASLDIEVSGDTQEKYDEILRALKAREKYESNRLRG